MRKNLLLAVIALGALSTTSCKEEMDYNENKYQENYLHAFIKEFGIIDPTHDWGFGPARNAVSSRDGSEGTQGVEGDDTYEAYVKTKVIDVNAEKWKNPPLIKDWERKAVMQYLHEHGAEGAVTLNLTKPYFMTHVGNCHAVAENDSQLEQHGVVKDGQNGDVNTWVQMNNLQVGYLSGANISELVGKQHTGYEHWAHVNNFNASSNTNYNGNTVVAGYGNGGSFDFAYENTKDDPYYNNYIIIPGSLIDFRLSSYYYLCFDYEANKKVTNTLVTIKYKTAENADWTTRSDFKVKDRLIKDNNSLTLADAKEALANSGINGLEDSWIDSYSISGYDPANLYVAADGIYDDWVIRICGNAVYYLSDEIPVYPHEDYEAFRIFVEDLSVRAQYNINDHSSDWDFNDVVFDAKITKTSDEGELGAGTVKIVLRALGGTLPIYICDKDGNAVTEELHSYFGVASNVMVNTGQKKTHDPVEITLPSNVFGINFKSQETIPVKPGKQEYEVTRIKATEYNKIRVFVNANGGKDFLEMKADKGLAPSKLCVPSYLAAPLERVHISDVYGKFKQYVNNKDIDFWDNALPNDGYSN